MENLKSLPGHDHQEHDDVADLECPLCIEKLDQEEAWLRATKERLGAAGFHRWLKWEASLEDLNLNILTLFAVLTHQEFSVLTARAQKLFAERRAQ